MDSFKNKKSNEKQINNNEQELSDNYSRVDYDEKSRYSCSGSGRIDKKFHLKQLFELGRYDS